MKKLLLLLSIAVTLVLVGCQKNTDAKQELVMGISPGPYSVLFLDLVKPQLEQQGYSFKLINFSSLLESDIALAEGAIDFNVDQHNAYLEVFNKQRKANLANLLHIPSVPAAIFSTKHRTLADLTDGMTVVIPQDPSNAARAYRLLAAAGWIKLKPVDNPVLLTKNDILANPHQLKIKEVDSSNIPRLLVDTDFAVIPGSIVYAAKIDHKTALLQEDILPELEISVAVRAEDVTKPWAQAIKAAYRSEEFNKKFATYNQDNYWIPPQENN